VLYLRVGKRLLDLAVAVVLLSLLSPILIVVAGIVWGKLGSPVLFHQVRPGRGARPFMLVKFRTMRDLRDRDEKLRPDGERLTPLGRFLRKTSLDELPELWNVLKGDMSLVGPRPLLPRYTPYFTEEERLRFTVRPGITGLAQVSGRNELNWDARIAADVEYVRKLSLRLDMHILFLTLKSALMREGLRVDPGAAMLDFDVERRQRMAKNGSQDLRSAQ
jgi:lipopolysaccharide/colanic/teichoic acid biosynthesis glycosyltransferase